MPKSPRIVPPVYLLIALLVMLLLHFLLPARQIIAWPWRWIGAALMGGGLLLGVMTIRSFIRHKTTIRPGEMSSHLMTGGTFAFSRNPIYLSMVLILAGAAVLLGSVTPWIVIPLFVWVISRNIIPVEEAMLAEAFGEEYRAYQKRVRRWI